MPALRYAAGRPPVFQRKFLKLLARSVALGGPPRQRLGHFCLGCGRCTEFLRCLPEDIAQRGDGGLIEFAHRKPDAPNLPPA